MSESLSGKLVVLTGAGGAFAGVVAPVLQGAGARLALVGHGQNLAQEAEYLGAEFALQADLTNPEDAARLAEWPAFALVHTVGGFALQKAQEATPLDARKMFALNFDTLFHSVHALLPGMLARGEGRIVGISAGQAARLVGAGAALYTASKAALSAYLRSLDAELKSSGVRASVVYPMGAIDSAANREGGLKSEAMIEPRDLAEGVLYILTRSKRGVVDELRVNPA